MVVQTTVSGFQTDFETELKEGDIVSFPSGAGGALEERRVVTISQTAQTFNISAAVTFK